MQPDAKKITLANYRQPILFYSFAIGISFLMWGIAAYISHLEPLSKTELLMQSVFIIIGMIVPITTAFIMILPNPALRKDVLGRIVNYKKIKLRYILIACLLMPASILLAQLISLLFGYGISQFAFAGKATFSAGLFSGWVLLLAAPLLEEFAWHTYGTDCLRNRFNLFTTCIIFTILWFLWHSPFFLVKGYYHSNLLHSGLIYTINYVVSFLPYVVIANWLYYKTGRTILVAILLHFTADVFAEMFATDPASKVIQTTLLLIFAIIIILKNRSFFFKLEYNED